MEDRMSSAWSVSVDIVGPLTNTVGLVTKRPVKYALMAVALVPDYTQEIKAVKDGDGLHDQGDQGERQEDEEQQNGGGVQPDSQGSTEGAVGDPTAELGEEAPEEEEQDILNPDMDYDEAAFAAVGG